MSRHAAQEARTERSGHRVGLIAFAVVLLVLVLVVVGGVAVVHSLGGSPAADYPGPGVGSVDVSVHSGDTASVIAATLTQAGVVKSSGSFVDAARADSRSRLIAPGTYRLKRQMSAAGALELMLTPTSRIGVVTIPEGTRLQDTLALVAKGSSLTLPALEAAARNPTALGLPAYAGTASTPEGFLFPAQYNVAPGADATSFLRSMVSRYLSTTDGMDLTARARAAGRDPYDVVIVASIVQDEVSPADYAKAARVIDNRLAAGTRLQLDSTVNYALNRKTARVSIADTKVASPYNTYLHAGLPPTPINSPGEAALEAALDPAKGDWLYWVTTNLKTGETKFTSSYSQFLQYKAEFDASQQ